MSDKLQNESQAERVYDALCQIYPVEVQSVQTLMAHVLTDLRHLADAHDLSFATRDRIAHMQYLAEIREMVE